MRRFWWISGFALALAGCAQDRQLAQSKPAGPSAPAAQSKPDPFATVLLSAKPDKLLSVRDVLTAKEGERVAVTGRTPPEKVKPFNASVAAFVLMDPVDLDKEDIQEEFDCDDAAT